MADDEQTANDVAQNNLADWKDKNAEQSQGASASSFDVADKRPPLKLVGTDTRPPLKLIGVDNDVKKKPSSDSDNASQNSVNATQSVTMPSNQNGASNEPPITLGDESLHPTMASDYQAQRAVKIEADKAKDINSYIEDARTAKATLNAKQGDLSRVITDAAYVHNDQTAQLSDLIAQYNKATPADQKKLAPQIDALKQQPFTGTTINVPTNKAFIQDDQGNQIPNPDYKEVPQQMTPQTYTGNSAEVPKVKTVDDAYKLLTDKSDEATTLANEAKAARQQYEDARDARLNKIALDPKTGFFNGMDLAATMNARSNRIAMLSQSGADERAIKELNDYTDDLGFMQQKAAEKQPDNNLNLAEVGQGVYNFYNSMIRPIAGSIAIGAAGSAIGQPEVGSAYITYDAHQQGFTNALISKYQELQQQNPQDQTGNYAKAKAYATQEGLTSAAVMAGGMGVMKGVEGLTQLSQFAGKSFTQGLSDFGVESTTGAEKYFATPKMAEIVPLTYAQVAKHAIGEGATFAGLTVAKNKYMQGVAQDLGIQEPESTEGAVGMAGLPLVMNTIMYALGKGKGFVEGQKNPFETLPQDTKNNLVLSAATYHPDAVEQMLTKGVDNKIIAPEQKEALTNEINGTRTAIASLPNDVSMDKLKDAIPLQIQIQKNDAIIADEAKGTVTKEDAEIDNEKLNRQLHEVLGTPLSFDEQKQYEDLDERQSGRNEKGQFENQLSDSEKELLKHFDKRNNAQNDTGLNKVDNTTPDGKEIPETKPVGKADDVGKETPTKVGNVSISGHGENLFTKLKLEDGTESDEDVLTTKGIAEAKQQAADIAADIKSGKRADVNTVFHGTVPRTQQTAKIVADELTNLLGHEVKTDENPLLDTWNIGKAEGNTPEGSFDEKAWANKPDEAPEGGESWNSFATRAKQAWEFLKAHPDNDHAIASSKMERMLKSLNEANGDEAKAKEIYFDKLKAEQNADTTGSEQAADNKGGNGQVQSDGNNRQLPSQGQEKSTGSSGSDSARQSKKEKISDKDIATDKPTEIKLKTGFVVRTSPVYMLDGEPGMKVEIEKPNGDKINLGNHYTEDVAVEVNKKLQGYKLAGTEKTNAKEPEKESEKPVVGDKISFLHAGQDINGEVTSIDENGNYKVKDSDKINYTVKPEDIQREGDNTPNTTIEPHNEMAATGVGSPMILSSFIPTIDEPDAEGETTKEATPQTKGVKWWNTVKDIFGGLQYNHLKSVSEKAYNEAVKYANSFAQSRVMIRKTATEIEKGGGKGAWENLKSALIESRLQGIEQRWKDMSESVLNTPDTDLEKQFKGSGKSAPIVKILDALNGKEEFDGENLSNDALAMLSQGRFDDLRSFLSNTFEFAGESIHHHLNDEEYDAAINKPGFQKALDTYKQTIEKPIAENHASNEGIFTDSKGPLDTYYPLIPSEVAEAQKRLWNTRKPLSKPQNSANSFATGLSKSYNASTESLMKKLDSAIRANNKASFIKTLEDENIIQPVDKNNIPTHISIGDNFTDRAVIVPLDDSKTIVSNGKTINTKTRSVAIPKSLYDEARSLFEPREPGVLQGDDEAKNTFAKVSNWITKTALMGYVESGIHAQNLMGGVVNGTPFLGTKYDGTAKKMIFNAASLNPVTKALATFYRGLTYDVSSPEAIARLNEKAKAGIINPKTGTITFSKSESDLTGAKLAKFYLGNLSPILYGSKGVDVRMRALMDDVLQTYKPDATVAERLSFQKNLGIYNRELEGRLAHFMKGNALSPFFTAASTFYKQGIRAQVGANPLPLSGLSPAKKAVLVGARLLGGSAVGMLGTWAMTYHLQTGNWPWEDKESKLLRLPFPEAAKNTPIGKIFYNKDYDTYDDISFGFFNETYAKGLKGLGLDAAYNTAQQGGTGGQMQEKAFTQGLNSGITPFLGSPLLHFAMEAATGSSPYILSMRDDRGRLSPKFFRDVKTEPSGIPQIGANITQALIDVNPVASLVAKKTGYNFGAKKEEGNWLKMITNGAFPRLFLSNYPNSKSEPYVKKEARTIQSTMRKEANKE